MPRDEDHAGSGADVPREADARPGSARAAPTLLGAVRAVADSVMRNPEVALIVAIVMALVGGIAGWW